MQKNTAFSLFCGQNKEKLNLSIDDLNQVKHWVKKYLKCVPCSYFKALVQFLLNKMNCILTDNKKTNTVNPLVCG